MPMMLMTMTVMVSMMMLVITMMVMMMMVVILIMVVTPNKLIGECMYCNNFSCHRHLCHSLILTVSNLHERLHTEYETQIF